MQAGGGGQLSRAEQQNFSLPGTSKFFGPFPFGSMNQQASRMSMPDTDLFWVENYIKVGDGNMRTVPDAGPALYTRGNADSRTMISFAWYNVGLIDYCILFFDDGSATQIDTAGARTTILAAGFGEFYVANGAYPATVGWGSIYLLIANNNTANDYWVWDGTILYGAGGVSPQLSLTSSGTSYVVTPGMIVFGGHGSGIVLEPTITNGSITALKVLSPGTGYVPGDVVQVRFFGGGSDESAHLTAVLETSTVNQVVVLAGGTGYATPPAVGLTGGGGSGAAAQATLVAVGVASITVVDGGTNYTHVPTLTFRGGFGSGAVATALLSGPGPIESVIVPVGSGGSGYTSLPTVTITDGGSGTGATAVVTGISGGVITAIAVVNAGSGYTAPSVGFSGGGGSGASAIAAVGAGLIASATVDHPGSGYTDAPAVIVEAGLNSAASATLDLMPFGVSGDSIETYDSQVWVQNLHQNGPQPTGGVRQSSAPGSISDFATSSGGLTETETSRFLRKQLTAIRQSNGFLYPFGDSSVNVISNVQVTGSPSTKKLTNLNTDPQTGTHWRDTLQDFSRTLLFANPFGVFGLFGGAVTKISGKMDLVFANANFPTGDNPQPPTATIPVTPSSAVANLYNRKVYLVLINLLDPFTGDMRNAMVCWNEQDWSIVSQSIDLAYIGTRETNSQLSAWGTDGVNLYPLLTTPSATLGKTFCSKLYGAAEAHKTKNARMIYVQAENFASATQAPAFTFTVDTEYASFPVSQNPAIAFPAPGQVLPASATAPVAQSPLLIALTGDVPGQELGFTLTSAGADHAIYNLMLASEDIGVFFG